MSADRIRDKLREVLGVEPEDTVSIDTSGWDSVDVLELIAAIDESYDVTVPIDRLHACRTAGELIQLIRSTAEGS